MTSGVSIVGSTQGASTAPVTTASAANAGTTFAPPPAPQALLQNPRVVLDPAAGFITEYLSANGSQVVSQSPSAITVAYLRLGLTADGLTKQAAAQAQLVGTTA